MAKVISGEKLADMQPMKLAAFDRPAKSRTHPSQPQPQAAPPKRVLEELARMREAARQEGYRQGAEEGRKNGYEEGMKAARDQVDRLNRLAEELDAARLREDQALAGEILKLSLAVAQQVVRGVIRVNPELLLDAMREAMLALPGLETQYRVLAHPEDAEFVRDWIAREHAHLGWEVLEDAQLQRGGFRIESAHSELDASLPTRWQQVIESMGADLGWLEPNA